MKYSLSSITARIPGLARTDTYDEADAGLRTLLIKGSVGTFALKVISTGLAFLISLLLARILRAEGYGIYAYTMAWVSLLGVLAVLGLDRLIVREVAVYQTQSAWGLMRGLLRRANQAVVVVSLVLTFLAALGAWILAGRSGSQMLISFWVALTMLPFVALNSLRQAALRGLNRVVVGQLPEMFFQPVLFITLIVAAYLFIEKNFTAPFALGMNVVAAGVAFIIGTRLLYKNLPEAARKTLPAHETRAWSRSALHLMLIASLQVINARADIVMLGAMKGTNATGIYAVATKGAELIAFILIAVNMALAPTIASLYAAKEMKRLQRLITQSARIILFISLPIGLGLIFFGNWFLTFVFGGEFMQGKTALSVLSIGQIINAGMGSVGLLLISTGHERDVTVGIGISALLNVVLNAFLIPIWGLEGAATATAASMIMWNILLAILVYRRLGIHSTALGRISLGRRYEKP